MPWLIEKTQDCLERERKHVLGCPGRYWAWHPFIKQGGRPEFTWTDDVHEAARFETREAAEAERNGNPELIVAEHLFGLGRDMDDLKARSRKTNPVFPLAAADVERFWELVERGDGCWRWTGQTLAKDGRGVLSVAGKNLLAPRISWSLFNGRDPGDWFVCHSCDNPNCVNPDHLWLGDTADNARDSAAKGRNPMQVNPGASYLGTAKSRTQRAKGSRHGSAKLLEADVHEIRSMLRDGVMHREIAKRFGVSPSMISRIKRGLAWLHMGERT